MNNNVSYPVIDSHVDLLFDLIRHHPHTNLADLPPDAWVTLPRLNSGGVRVIVSAYYCEDSHNGPAKAADNLRSLLDYADRRLEGLRTIRDEETLRACFAGTGIPGALPLLENADALLEFPAEMLKKRGFRLVGLTHVGKNRIGDGNRVKNPEGLTPEGLKLIRELDGLGFAIDTAHLSPPCFAQVADMFSGHLLSTHTGFRAFCDTPRNLDEEQIRTILSRGGVIGLAAYPGMLSGDGGADIHEIFRQIDWFVQKFGPEGIGLGTDFGGYDGVCEGFVDHTSIPQLAGMLEEAGYPEASRAAILGENWLRLFSRILAQ